MWRQAAENSTAPRSVSNLPTYAVLLHKQVLHSYVLHLSDPTSGGKTTTRVVLLRCRRCRYRGTTSKAGFNSFLMPKTAHLSDPPASQDLKMKCYCMNYAQGGVRIAEWILRDVEPCPCIISRCSRRCLRAAAPPRLLASKLRDGPEASARSSSRAGGSHGGRRQPSLAIYWHQGTTAPRADRFLARHPGTAATAGGLASRHSSAALRVRTKQAGVQDIRVQNRDSVQHVSIRVVSWASGPVSSHSCGNGCAYSADEMTELVAELAWRRSADHAVRPVP
ncbi:hypothetical protein P280DRAFT_178745 [Massarina eburnea CBS 473.64]|uniref:Uncharacterized protein n=1 Tax=Massarina eburnea CBS 473.64 TaxID=1395130 RepID=A0A6A6SA24_9PLEO|nr:hypothetical protein P280DRAFT_178745 [Massarina eburnea CBS 473.64]